MERCVKDLIEPVQSGEMSVEEAQAIVMNRLTSTQRLRKQMREEEAKLDPEDQVQTQEVVAIVSTRHDPEDPGFAAALDALTAVLSGPPSSPERRGRWPRRNGLLNADPVATAKVVDGAFVIAFASEEAARVWVWKMNYEVFAGEGACFCPVKNMDFVTFRLPNNLDHIVRYIVDEKIASVDGELFLALGADDDVGRYEAGFGRKNDGREPLSTWLARCVKRLKGDLDYVTANYDDLPPGALRDDVDTSMEM